MRLRSLAPAVALGLFGIAQPSAQPGSRRITVDDLMAMRAIVDVRISPDGQRVAYVTSTPSLAKNEHEASLFVVASTGGPVKRLGDSIHIFNTPTPAPRLRWSPDGTAVSLVALVDGRPQIAAVPVDGSPPRILTAAAEGAFAYEWSPDGRRVAYVTRDPMPETEARQRQDRSFVIHADAPDRPTRLAIQDVTAGMEGPPAGRIITPAAHYVDALSWAPDGRDLAYSASSRAGFTSPYYTRIYRIAADGGTPTAIVDRAGTNSGPRFSRDGRWIAFITTSERVDIMAPRSLAIVESHGGAPRVFGLDDAWVNEYEWAPDSASIYLQSNDGTFGRDEHMFEQALVRISIPDGRAERMDEGPVVNYSISVSGDGSRIAYRKVAGSSMGEVVVRDVARRADRRLVDSNPELPSFDVGHLRAVRWRSFDGMDIWGLLLTPREVEPGRKLPLLVYIHGGPGGGVTYGLFPQFMGGVSQVDPYPTAAFASAGYAVLFPMPRGGAGYGERGQRMIVNSWGDGDYKDIMTGVDKLIADGIADPDRLGVMGASYGGYMTNWIVTQTGRFKAASAGASISDLADLYLLSEGGEFIVEYFKRPWENRESYVAHSPLTFADRVTTPLLIQHGEVDPRVPIAGAWKFYRTLKAMGKTVEFDIYPRGGHVLREPQQQRAQMQRNYDWFTRWIR